MEPILTGSEERACSFFSEDAGMAEAYPEKGTREKLIAMKFLAARLFALSPYLSAL